MQIFSATVRYSTILQHFFLFMHRTLTRIHSSRSDVMLNLSLGAAAARSSPGGRVVAVFLRRGGLLLLLRFSLARHDLDVPYVDDLAAVLSEGDVLNVDIGLRMH